MFKKGLLSILDQIGVSGGNFLIVILCSHYCDAQEMGKLAYILTLYILITLVYVSAIFYPAPVINSRLDGQESLDYRTWLLKYHLILGITLCIILISLLKVYGHKTNWNPNYQELFLIFSLLISQQISDFYRRSCYVFSGPKEATFVTLPSNILKIIVLIFVQPKSFAVVAIILTAISTPIAIFVILKYLLGHPSTIRKSVTREHFSFAKWAVLSAPLAWLAFYMPMLYVGVYQGLILLGVLQSLRSIINVGNIFMELLETLIPKWLAGISSTIGNKEMLKANLLLVKIAMIAWLIGFITIVGLHKIIIETLTPYSSKSYGMILVLFWIGVGFHCYARIKGLAYRMSSNPSVEFIGNLSCAAMSLISLPLIKYYGLYGAGAAYILVPIAIILTQILLPRGHSLETG